MPFREDPREQLRILDMESIGDWCADHGNDCRLCSKVECPHNSNYVQQINEEGGD